MDGVFAKANPYRFSTKPLDEACCLYYYGYRYYEPGNGRWLNRDPIEEKGGLNLLGMNNNNLISQIDILGMFHGMGAATEYWDNYGQTEQISQAEIDAARLTSADGLSFLESFDLFYSGVGAAAGNIPVSLAAVDPGWDKITDFVDPCSFGGTGGVDEIIVPIYEKRNFDVFHGLDTLLNLSTDTNSGPGEIEFVLKGVLKIKSDCTWEFTDGVLTALDNPFDFDIRPTNPRPPLKEFMTFVPWLGQKTLGLGGDFNVTFHGERLIPSQSGKCQRSPDKPVPTNSIQFGPTSHTPTILQLDERNPFN